MLSENLFIINIYWGKKQVLAQSTTLQITENYHSQQMQKDEVSFKLIVKFKKFHDPAVHL